MEEYTYEYNKSHFLIFLKEIKHDQPLCMADQKHPLLLTNYIET